jgi:D-alanine transaminase
MSQIAYVNGEFLPEQDAKISIFDRGFLFADGIYEVVPVVGGQLINRQAHRERLTRSLREMRLQAPLSIGQIEAIQDEIVRRNQISEGRVYLQVTRGPAERDFAFPAEPQPTLIMFGRQSPLFDTPAVRNGIKVKILPENRWARRDIKTVMLIPSSLAKQQVIDEGFHDAWFSEDGLITEGTSNNAFIIKGNSIYTQPLSSDILAGCTRRTLLQLVAESDVELVEQAFSPQQAYQADEAFMTSASSTVTPVVQIDEHMLGDGTPGPLTRRLQEIYKAHANAQAAAAA